jgi:hypothetical protein
MAIVRVDIRERCAKDEITYKDQCELIDLLLAYQRAIRKKDKQTLRQLQNRAEKAMRKEGRGDEKNTQI